MKTMRKLHVAAAAACMCAMAQFDRVDSASPVPVPDNSEDEPKAVGLNIVGLVHSPGASTATDAVMAAMAVKNLDDLPPRRPACAVELRNVTINVGKANNKPRRGGRKIDEHDPAKIGMVDGVCVTPQGLGEQSAHRDQAGFHSTPRSMH